MSDEIINFSYLEEIVKRRYYVYCDEQSSDIELED
jgi:hypothetical protein